jgi:hypothetical protein
VMIRQVTVSDEVEQGDFTYRTATLELWRRKSKWQEVWPSRGFNQRVTVPVNSPFINVLTQQPDSTQKQKLLSPITINGERPTEPQFLDKDGKWIREPTLSQVVFITTQLYPAINFAGYFPIK